MKKLQMNKGSSTLNFIGNLCAFFITYSIGFFLSPYIVGILGEEAYGFVSLAQNFTNYISIVTVSLNALASRFVSIAIYQKDIEKAKRYYSSVIISNVVLSAVLIIPCTLLILNLERIISVPVGMVTDVKILFAVIFAGFFISLLTSLFSVGVFVENRLYLTARHNAEAGILRLALTILLLKYFAANVVVIGVVSVVCNIYVILWQRYYLRKFQPELRVQFNLFDKTKVVELVKSGAWNLVSQLSYFLNAGFDLLLANQFISSSAMGVLSIAGTLPSMIRSIFGSVSSSFTPNLTKNYAEKNHDAILKEIIYSSKMMNLVLIVPLAGLTIFGTEFYALWQPTQDASVLHLLSVIRIFTLTFTAGLASVHEIFTIANKLKAQSIATLLSGVGNIALVFVLVNTTDLGVYAIAGSAVVMDLIRNFTFTIPYAAKCINQKAVSLYLIVFRAFGIYVLICGLFYCIDKIFAFATGWLGLILCAAVCALIGYVLVALLLLGWKDSKTLAQKLIRKFLRRGAN